MRPRSSAAVLAWAAWAVVVGAVAALVWLDHLMRRAGREDLGTIDAVGLIFAGGVLTSATLGAVVVWRARHVVGWFMIGLAASVVSSGLGEAYTPYGVLADPGAVPTARWASPFSEAMFWPAFTFLALIMLFTPTGRLPSPRWRRFVVAITGGAVAWVISTLFTDEPPEPPLDAVHNPMAISSLEVPLLIAGVIGIVLTHGGVVVAGFSLVRRARRATGAERQQLRWVGFGAAVAGVAVVAALLSALADQPALLNVAAATLVIMLPTTVTIALSRYRLGPNMRRLRTEVHHRLLGNGRCQRPAELDCSFESICETCTHFATGPSFRPVLLRQRNHATRNGQTGRAELFDQLLETIERPGDAR